MATLPVRPRRTRQGSIIVVKEGVLTFSFNLEDTNTKDGNGMNSIEYLLVLLVEFFHKEFSSLSESVLILLRIDRS